MSSAVPAPTSIRQLGAVGLFLLMSWVMVAAMTLLPARSAEVVGVLFPPWWSEHHVFEAAASADVTIVRQSALPFLLIVQARGGGAFDRLRRAGTWLIVDPQALAACFSLRI